MNQAESRVCAEIQRNRDGWIGLLQRMVAAQSCNPPGDTREPAAVIAAVLEEYGIPCREITVEGIHRSLIASIGTGETCLLFNGHIDTVPVGDLDRWSVDPFREPLHGDTLYGRGCADDKGGVAAMIAAMCALKSCGVVLRGRMVVNPVADEETGGANGTEYLIQNGHLKPDWVVVGEITTNSVAIVHKGLSWFEITSCGRTAHASTPWEGSNAISHMVALLHRLEEYYRRELPLHTDPLTPPATYSIGTIQGGVKPNVVADRCTVVIDRRTLPEETVETAREEILAAIREVQADFPGAQFDCRVINESPSLRTSPTQPLVQTALGVAGEFGRSAEPVGYQQCSDGRFFSALGIPTVLIGPGDPAVGHAPDESIDVNQVVECAKIYAVLAMRMLGFDPAAPPQNKNLR